VWQHEQAGEFKTTQVRDQFSYQKIEKSRIATFDTFSVGLRKHHIYALIEFDVTESRSKLRVLRRQGINISLNAWLIKVIGSVLHKHPEAAAYLYNKKKLLFFNNISISMLVEKKTGTTRVPMPLVIEKVNEKTAGEISLEIEKAREQELQKNDIVLKRETSFYERVYYHLPGFLRRLFWVWLLSSPRTAYRTMGNAAVTSVGMMGKINGWFIHKSVHPLSFGVGSVLRKPVVRGDEIKIREILNMTILIDHDVIDGAQMVRFLNELTDYIETGKEINL
jgi:pyruvate/2-oxoglutarate dehydrogenase complex dihydrolipoamide acyltransferase (E2) component